MIQQPTIRSILDQIKTDGQLTRTGTLTRAKGEDGKEIEDTYELSFSSEEPYERYFGIEILGHKKTEVELDWLKAGSAPLLWQHDRSTVIGVVEKANIEGGRGKAVVRFGKSEKAREVLADVAGGILRNVSVGYEVNAMELVKAGKDGPSTYRVTSWKPLEVSIVSIPADQTVGVGRSSIHPNQENPVKKHLNQFHEQPESGSGAAPLAPAAPVATDTRAAATASGQPTAVDELRRERARVIEIQKIADQHKVPDLATKAIADGVTVEAFQKNVLDAVHQKNLAQGGVFTGAPVGGLSQRDKRDLRNYSFLRAITCFLPGNQLSGFELEMHHEAIRQSREQGLAVMGLGIPTMVLSRADLTVADDGTNLVQTSVMTDFIGALRNKVVMQSLGARFLTGLSGNVSMPKLTAGASATWEGENDAGAESEPTTGKVSLSPKRLGLYSDISKQLLVQSSPDIEMMLRNDILLACAHGIDAAAISGSGSGGQPTGILATSGIGDVAGGTNGLAPTWAHIIELESDVAVANAPDNALGYLTNAKVRGKLKATARVASTDSRMIWEGGETPLNGYKCAITNAVPSTLTKGSSSVCSAIIFGNFSDVIIGQWGGLDLVVDPYTLATTGLVRLTANVYADVAVRYAASFSAMQDALTT